MAMHNFSHCIPSTGGSCGWFDCDSSRGPTTCVDGACLCKPGYCSFDGTCLMDNKCTYVTESVCGHTGCPKEATTSCINNKCVCKAGTCVDKAGFCTTDCPKDTGGTCSWAPCDPSRGLTACIAGRCLCKQPDECSSNGRCGNYKLGGKIATLAGEAPASHGPAQMFGVLVLVFAVLALIMRAMRRGGGRRKVSGGMPLLDGAEGQVMQHAAATRL
eukprot:NODE_15543_length_1044_cov_10.381679.p1 GENE.NODE_15543_length_1044_cov_10.381679~~NODE_15543_length_1044_cov_10.381679.p1  ORF type:complete len:216 (+),score=31.13 NODE_15543_length_1044_cov_10.381679:172-819(+)